MMNVMRTGPKQKSPTEAANRDRYNQHYTRFVEGEFTYNTHQLVKKISEIGQKEPYMYGIPLYKIMIEVVKIMMMNELEALFLASTLQEMKWKITDPCLNDYIDEATDISPKLQKDTEAKRVQFSLLLIAYIVKIYTNDEYALFDFKIRDIIKNNFERMYQTWVQRVSSNFRFNPKNMNRIFKDFDTKQHDKNHHIIDYNKLVNDFFKINDTSYTQEEPPHEPEHQHRAAEHQPYPQTHYPTRYHRDQERSIYREPSRGQRRNEHFELPLEELDIPEEPQRRQSARLNRQISEIGFNRKQSANEFFNPESNDKPSIFRLDMFRSESKHDQ